MVPLLKEKIEFKMGMPQRMLPTTDVTMKNPDSGQTFKCKCLWDTGATGTCVTPKVIEALNLQPISSVLARAASNSASMQMYLADIDLGPFGFKCMPIAGLPGDINGITDVIIGMDIIGRGTLVLATEEDEMTLRFSLYEDRYRERMIKIGIKRLEEHFGKKSKENTHI